MNKHSILIIDDNFRFRELLKLTLRLSDYNILEAENANDGIYLTKKHHPDVILLDVQLPGELDGFGICNLIKSDPLLRDIRVIMLSAMGSQTDLAMGGQCGADAYIVKPFRKTGLLESIKI